MNLYSQGAEAQLLADVLPALEHQSVIDVGAERGSFSAALLPAGATEIHAFEPEPQNAEYLRARFTDDRVKVHELALSDRDGDLSLRLSRNPADDTIIPFGHTVLERPGTDEIGWNDSLTVKARSLGSLVESKEIPNRVGIVKIDTEGHDLSVIAGMGELECDVLMTEYWIDLPYSLGPCPWTMDELTADLGARGFTQFAFISHRGELTLLQWNDARIARGAMGNVIFFHDRVVSALLPRVLNCASRLAMAVAEAAESNARVAAERLVVIRELEHEVTVQSKAAAERLAAIEALGQPN